MVDDERFKKAISAIDAANQEDPRSDMVDGREQPRELLFATRVYQLVQELVNTPSEELLLAARAHTIRRWVIPRERYAGNTAGYHEWRDALAKFHAEQTRTILEETGYPQEGIARVEALITKLDWPADAEACALEDADCLAFLEMKLHKYLDEWDKSKLNRIVRRTLRKMTAPARQRALELNLSEAEHTLLQHALR